MNKIDLRHLVLLALYLNTPIYWFFEDCYVKKPSLNNKGIDKRNYVIAQATPDAFHY
ncbi:fimbrial operon regulator [Proteus mirabilis]|nr:fimbrial operon regulator [Proteus mirabilis]